jgi:hypothetical protein
VGPLRFMASFALRLHRRHPSGGKNRRRLDPQAHADRLLLRITVAGQDLRRAAQRIAEGCIKGNAADLPAMHAA